MSIWKRIFEAPGPASDQVVETTPPSYELSLAPEGPGLEFTLPFTLLEDLPEEAQVLLWFRGAHAPIRAAHPPWADEDGDLCVEAQWVEDEDGETSWTAFLPFVTVPDDCPSDVTLEVWLVVDDEVLFEEQWNVELPPLEERLESSLPGALTCAAVHLALAGGGLQRVHVRAMKEELGRRFEFDDYGFELMRRVQQRARAGHDDPERWGAALADLDEDEQADFASALVGMARLDEDGYVDRQARYLLDLFDRLGFDPSVWDELLELDEDVEDEKVEEETTAREPVTIESHLATLELTGQATWEEVRVAYKRLARAYHPDTVATLPTGFQQFAHQKMAQLNAAYEALKKHHGR